MASPAVSISSAKVTWSSGSKIGSERSGTSVRTASLDSPTALSSTIIFNARTMVGDSMPMDSANSYLPSAPVSHLLLPDFSRLM